jgi:hypothetical protein
MKKLCVVTISLLFTSILSAASESSIRGPTRVEQEIKKAAEQEWPGDYRMQAYEIRTQTQSYRKIESWTRKMRRTKDRQVCKQIGSDAKQEWPGDYRMQWYQIRTQMESYRTLNDS